jgi:hypothetical protein
MASMFERNIRQGMAVTSRDGVQLGRVVGVSADGLIVEKGQFFHKDYRVAFGDVAAVHGDVIVLAHGREDLQKLDRGHAEKDKPATPGIAAIHAPPSQGGLGLRPGELTEARMDSAKFQDHEQYDVGGVGAGTQRAAVQPPAREPPAYIPPPAEPAFTERRAAGPGWDPLSVDEDTTREAPRTSGPDTDTKTRY